ncbi:MAG TPA: DUF2397 family protein [Thermoanaerobaculia bacterium]|jgi:uncharacterized protein (TIGR02677 family)|nr:DUF2397 family protein [Thermoanaerobaculia bacterium]
MTPEATSSDLGRLTIFAYTVEPLRAAARGAINRILLVLERLHEKRFRRFSRTADLLRLAGWFDGLATAEEAHRLFQQAFGLFGARHLGGLDEDPDLVLPATSWWEAPPVPVAPALRRTGRGTALGRIPPLADHSEVNEELPAVATYQLYRDPTLEGVAAVRMVWHGRAPQDG